MKRKLKKIIKHYGIEHQIGKLIEELQELSEAIIEKKEVEKMYIHIIEEMADVLVMIEQMIIIFDCKKEIKDMIKYKIKRTLGRIDNG